MNPERTDTPDPPDQAVRDRIINSTGRSMLVEAGAGTGKTTLVVDRIIAGVRDGSLALARTVAITFTEKAAGELEERVRAELDRALHAPELTPPERTRLRTARRELDRANISTIHSFCARLLREKPIEAGVDPQFEVLDATATTILRGECWQQWMDQQVADSPAPLVQSLRAGVSVQRLREVAELMTGAPEVVQRVQFSLPTPDGSFDQTAAEVVRRAGDVVEFVEQNLSGNGNKDNRGFYQAARRIVRAGAEEEGAVRRHACAAAEYSPEAAKKSFRGRKEEAEELFSRFEQAASEVGAQLAARTYRWLSGFVDFYQRSKRDRSVLDFQDLLLYTARMLRRRPAVRSYFQRRFDAFFVDEFQDTDPLQAELVGYLCERPDAEPADRMADVRLADGKLVAVGDPKQSIYRFRRADVEIYERFKRLFGTENVEQIACNFRSAGPLLRWYNRLFAEVFGQPTAEGVYQADHVDLLPPSEEGRPAVCPVAALCPPPAVREKELNSGPARQYEAHFIAHAVRGLVEGGVAVPGVVDPLDYGDFAILLRSLTDCDTYSDALDRYGVPYRVIGGKHFYRREQAAETVAVLRAVDDPLDEDAVVAALRSSFFGFSDEDLLEYRAEGGRWNYLRAERPAGPLGEAMGRLAEWHGRRNGVAPHVLLREILDRTRAREAFLMKPAGEQRVANLEKIVDQVRSLGGAVRTFGGVVRHLSDMQERELPEEESSAMEPGDRFVRIMSMHKAKGLEFEAVILPDLARQFRNKVDRLLYDRLDRQVAVRLTKGIQSPGYERLREREQGNQEAELSRLLYVACTRAKRLLMLSLNWWSDRGRGSFQRLLRGTGLLAGPQGVPYGDARHGVYYPDTRPWAEAIDPAPRPSRVPEGGPAETERLLRERERWLESHRRAVARACAGRHFVLPSEMEGTFRQQPGGREQPAEEAGGRELGALFHQLMASLPLPPADPEPSKDHVSELAHYHAGELEMDPEEAERAADLARSALGCRQFRGLLRRCPTVEREVPFSVPLSALEAARQPAEGFLEGSIDLVMRGGGRTVILDYKTDRFRPEERDAVAGRYWPQLGLYALARRACNPAGGQPELALFFVRAERVMTRRLDADLLEQLVELL
ncbi:MAG: UvrD-helicase domain-containing protein [Planctomycetota bacterium]